MKTPTSPWVFSFDTILFMHNAVIFDFFGVFCPDISLEWFKKTVPQFELKLSRFKDICTRSDYGKLSMADFYEEVSTLVGMNVSEIKHGVEAETIINNSLVTFVQGLKDKGYAIVCLSNGTQEWTLGVIRDNGLSYLFDEVVLSGDLGIVKPSSEIYMHTLDKLNITASQAIFVDDRLVNTKAAEACGISSLVFSDTKTFIHEFEAIS